MYLEEECEESLNDRKQSESGDRGTERVIRRREVATPAWRSVSGGEVNGVCH
jgi:hypothetical protein